VNIKSARKGEEFCQIVKTTGREIIVKVPGHQGRLYFVKIEWTNDLIYKVTCRHSKKEGGKACSGNQISNSICYHSAAAIECFFKNALAAGKQQTLGWAPTKAAAEKTARLINGAVYKVTSTQGNGETWIAVRQPKNQGERGKVVRDIALACKEGSDKIARDKAMVQATSSSRTNIWK